MSNTKEKMYPQPDAEDFFSFLDNTGELSRQDSNDSSIFNKKDVKSMFLDFNEEENENETEKEKENLLEKSVECCIRCGEMNTLYNDLESIVCRICGCENSMILDVNPEWRFYGNDDNKRSSDPNRCGLPSNPYIKNSSLSTVMLGYGTQQYRKINKWNGLGHKERSFMTILNMVSNKALLENVPQSIIDKTIHDYQTYCSPNVKKGTAVDSLIAACFLEAMKEHGYMRTDTEIARLFGMTTKKLSKGCNEFDFYRRNNDSSQTTVKPISLKEMIISYSTYLDFTDEQIKSCLMALYGVEKMGLCRGNVPKSIVVGIIYLISEFYEIGYTKKDIGDLCKISDVTVGNTYAQMLPYIDFLIPQSQNKKK